MKLSASKITETSVLRVLAAGFVMVLLPGLMAGLAGVQSLRSIQDNAADLVLELRLASNLVVQIQRQLIGLSALTHRLAKSPGAIDAEEVRALVADAEANIAGIAESGQATAEAQQWRKLEVASRAFSEEARRCLELEDVPIAATRDLFDRHQDLVSVAAALTNLSYRRAVQSQARIDAQSRSLIGETGVIVGVSVALAAVFAALTLIVATRLIRQLENQSGELIRVSWHLLESQESAARRFSHELHDELGQSLTAVKAHLAALRPAIKDDPSQLDETLALVDEAMENAREMSHLLHPRVLDDFGLAAALRSLTERLAQRTAIRFSFESDLEQRLPRETATHLFRIAQEALTNIMKHSHATSVEIQLRMEGRAVTLSIRDNGRGFPESTARPGLGLVAMGARAQQMGGELKLRSQPGRGALVEVTVPEVGEYDGEEDRSIAG
jgi:signal transduction histidine kinase